MKSFFAIPFDRPLPRESSSSLTPPPCSPPPTRPSSSSSSMGSASSFFLELIIIINATAPIMIRRTIPTMRMIPPVEPKKSSPPELPSVSSSSSPVSSSPTVSSSLSSLSSSSPAVLSMVIVGEVTETASVPSDTVTRILYLPSSTFVVSQFQSLASEDRFAVRVAITRPPSSSSSMVNLSGSISLSNAVQVIIELPETFSPILWEVRLMVGGSFTV